MEHCISFVFTDYGTEIPIKKISKINLKSLSKVDADHHDQIILYSVFTKDSNNDIKNILQIQDRKPKKNSKFFFKKYMYHFNLLL